MVGAHEHTPPQPSNQIDGFQILTDPSLGGGGSVLDVRVGDRRGLRYSLSPLPQIHPHRAPRKTRAIGFHGFGELRPSARLTGPSPQVMRRVNDGKGNFDFEGVDDVPSDIGDDINLRSEWIEVPLW